MPSTISAGTTAGTAIAIAGDTTGNLAFQTNGTTTAMTITTSQNVGIGTSSPSYRLHVANSSATSTTLLANILARLQSNASGADASLQFSDNVANSAGISLNQGNMTFSIAGGSAVQIDTSANLKFNSGYGSVATAYGCRAWANWNGSSSSPITPRSNGNVSSVTKNSTGDFTVNFTNAMPDVNYSVVGTGQRNNTNLLILSIKGSASYDSINTGSVNIRTTDEAGNLVDALAVCIAVFR